MSIESLNVSVLNWNDNMTRPGRRGELIINEKSNLAVYDEGNPSIVACLCYKKNELCIEYQKFEKWCERWIEVKELLDDNKIKEKFDILYNKKNELFDPINANFEELSKIIAEQKYRKYEIIFNGKKEVWLRSKNEMDFVSAQKWCAELKGTPASISCLYEIDSETKKHRWSILHSSGLLHSQCWADDYPDLHGWAAVISFLYGEVHKDSWDHVNKYYPYALCRVE